MKKNLKLMNALFVGVSLCASVGISRPLSTLVYVERVVPHCDICTEYIDLDNQPSLVGEPQFEFITTYRSGFSFRGEALFVLIVDANGAVLDVHCQKLDGVFDSEVSREGVEKFISALILNIKKNVFEVGYKEGVAVQYIAKLPLYFRDKDG